MKNILIIKKLEFNTPDLHALYRRQIWRSRLERKTLRTYCVFFRNQIIENS